MIFHRVAEDFMIQTGDPTGTGRGGPGRRAPDEYHPELKFNRKGLLGLANSGVPNSGGSQFFITVRESAEFLDGKNPIFGEVVLGQRVADAISQASVDANSRPTTPIALRTIRRLEHPGWDNVGITIASQLGQVQYRFFVPAWNRPPAMDGWLLDPGNRDTIQADPGVVNVLSDGAGQRTIAMTIAGFYPQAELRGTGFPNASWQRGLSLVFDQSRETIRLPHPLNDGTWTPHSYYSPRGVHLDQLTRSGSWKSVREGFFVSGTASATQGFANRLTLPAVKNTADEVAIWYHVVVSRDSVASIELTAGLVQEIDRGGDVVTSRVTGSDSSAEEQFLLPRGFTQSGTVVLVIFSADSARVLVNGQPAHEIPLNLTALDEIQPVLMANGEVMWGGLGIAARIGP
jgi:cyclophilin family peptidyl-prolyl cis-trans isomerase